MTKYYMPRRCYVCGKFISWAKAIDQNIHASDETVPVYCDSHLRKKSK